MNWDHKTVSEKFPMRFDNQIAIVGSCGTGTSTLLERLKMRFFDLPYRYVSGGSIMRAKAVSCGFSTIEEFARHNLLHPEEGNDAWCEETITVFGRQNYVVCEARLANITMPHAFKVCLVCDIEVCARRMDLYRRLKHYPGLDTSQIMQVLAQRNEDDERRYEALYPGCIWELADYDLVVDTSVNQPERVEDLVFQGHSQWLKTISPERLVSGVTIPE